MNSQPTNNGRHELLHAEGDTKKEITALMNVSAVHV